MRKSCRVVRNRMDPPPRSVVRRQLSRRRRAWATLGYAGWAGLIQTPDSCGPKQPLSSVPYPGRSEPLHPAGSVHVFALVASEPQRPRAGDVCGLEGQHGCRDRDEIDTTGVRSPPFVRLHWLWLWLDQRFGRQADKRDAPRRTQETADHCRYSQSGSVVAEMVEPKSILLAGKK